MNRVCFEDIKGIRWFLFRSTVKGLKIKRNKNNLIPFNCKYYIFTDFNEIEIGNDEFDKLMIELFNL